LRIPKLGTVLSPAPLLSLLLAAVTIPLLGAKAMHPHTPRDRPTATPPGPRRARALKLLLIALDLGLLAALGALVVIGRQPAATSVIPHLTTRLTYSAAVEPSDTYPTGTISTGDPVYLRLVDSIDVHVHHSIDAPPQDVSGTSRLGAVISTADGWETTLALAPPSRFVGSELELHGTLDLRGVRELAERVSAATGTSTDNLAIVIVASGEANL